MKMPLSIVMLLGIVVAAFGQTDTTQSDAVEPRRMERPDPTLPTATQPSLPPPTGYRSANPMIRIRIEDVPSGLRETLQGSEYRGWERGELFRDETTNEYRIDIRYGDSLRTFRFDSKGNPRRTSRNNRD